jgi:hypothetical protein
MFKLNHFYMRREIADKLRGGLEPYLPTSSGRVVAGCFRRSNNPQAPDVVLVGSGPRIRSSAAMLAAQKTPIPVFMKDDINRWEYVGRFRVRDWLHDKRSIRRYSKGSIRLDITSVLL